MSLDLDAIEKALDAPGDREAFADFAVKWLPALVQRARELEAANARLNKECGVYLNRIQHAHEEERETCAKIAEEHARSIGDVTQINTAGGAMDIGHIDAGHEIAEAIRERGANPAEAPANPPPGQPE